MLKPACVLLCLFAFAACGAPEGAAIPSAPATSAAAGSAGASAPTTRDGDDARALAGPRCIDQGGECINFTECRKVLHGTIIGTFDCGVPNICCVP